MEHLPSRRDHNASCNSAHAGLYRLEQLIQEAVVTVPRRLIAEAIDIVVFLKGRGSGRRIETIAALDGLTADGDYRLTPLTPSISCHRPE